MKAFPVIFTIISVAVLTCGLPCESDTFDSDDLRFDSNDIDLDDLEDFENFDTLKGGGFPITEKEIVCLRDGILRASLTHPGLRSWFEDLLTTGEKLLKRAYGCSKMSGIRRRLCFARLELAAAMEYGYLRKQLGKEGKAVINDLKGIVKSCLGIGLEG